MFLTLLSSMCLSITVLFISFKINNSKLLEYVGKNTIPILIFHKLPIILFQSKMGIITTLLCNSNIFVELIVALCVTSVSIIFSLIGGIIVRKIHPILLGE